MPDFQSITDPFIDELKTMEAQLIKRIEQALAGNLSNIDLATLNAELDLFAELNALGYETKLAEYFGNYDKIVKDIHNEAVKRGLSGLAGTSARDLEILALNEEIFALDKGRLHTQRLKTSVMRGIIGGQTIGEILPTLQAIPLTDAQLTTEISTGISNFYATVTADVFAEDPNQKFTLGGPLDDKTRDTCRKVLEGQFEASKDGFTRAEIDAGAWAGLAGDTYTFIERGTFNCRHFPVPK